MHAPRAARAQAALDNDYVKPSQRIFDNAKVCDHFAIIPTLQAPKSLSEVEQKLYDLVVTRFMAVFFPSAEFLVTTRISRARRAQLQDRRQGPGQARLARDLRARKRRTRRAEGPQSLVPVSAGEMVRAEIVDAKALKTRPPARYTEATLLGAMEGAGKLIDDDELREAMQEKGLGTPATRAAIIEGLINEKYMHPRGARADSDARRRSS